MLCLRTRPHYQQIHGKSIFLHDDATSHDDPKLLGNVSRRRCFPFALISEDLSPIEDNVFSSMGYVLAEQQFEPIEDSKNGLISCLHQKTRKSFDMLSTIWLRDGKNVLPAVVITLYKSHFAFY